MANLKEIRSRIASINSTMQITSAMKMVSAAKSKKAQDAITAMKPYANKLNELLHSLGAALGESNPFMPRTESPENILVVAITSDRGLCGAFNSNIIKQALAILERFEGKNITFRTIGKKGNDVLRKTGKVTHFDEHIFDSLSFAKIVPIAEELMNAYQSGTYDKIILVYNSFKNVATQIVMEETFLPIQPATSNDELQSDYIYEPSKQAIVDALVPKSLKMQLYKALRDSFAAEHGARMTAMHKATDNATELRNQLKLTYNKARQTTITNEILEIVAGAEALGK
ncbi:MAG: ATP synthase F1 subunit gamma [Capnocytophaga sp.]|nr:ATP synthase F1 subunit gamma [Capnocytophaga sp.]